MKATSKYGSAYPESAATNKARGARLRRGHSGVVSADTPQPSTMALPHERDESIDRVGGGVASESVEQAGRDVKRGLVDTDRSVDMSSTYQKQKI